MSEETLGVLRILCERPDLIPQVLKLAIEMAEEAGIPVDRYEIPAELH